MDRLGNTSCSTDGREGNCGRILYVGTGMGGGVLKLKGGGLRVILYAAERFPLQFGRHGKSAARPFSAEEFGFGAERTISGDVNL